MGVGAGLYMHDVVVESSRSLFHLLMSSCLHRTAQRKTFNQVGNFNAFSPLRL